MITAIVLAVGFVVGGGIALFEHKKRKEEKKDQEFQDKWLGR